MHLTTTDLRFSYGRRPILDGVSLSVSTGEAVAITGPSGTGKTTLLSLLGGMQRPQSGQVSIDGNADVGGWVSWVLQTVNVLPNRTVLENVALGASSSGLGRSSALGVAASRLREVGLTDRAMARARTVSGGELQRVVIARGLASSRPFLLADEPTGQLDRATTTSVVECLLAARRERGIVIVTHDPLVASQCDRSYQLDDGVLTASSSGAS